MVMRAASTASISLLLLASVALMGGRQGVANGLTFGVIGDWGLGGYAGGYTPEIISNRRYVETCRKINCNFTISTGDNWYCGQVNFCIEHSFEEDMKDMPGPFFPSVGNHDNVGAQQAYSKRNPRWYFPAHYYTVKIPIDDTGYTVQLFAVNGNSRSLRRGGQLNWLRDELRKSNARWKIIFGHFPTTGSGWHKRTSQVSQIHGLMKQFNAQAYFCGHDHIVEVSNVEGRLIGISGGMARGGGVIYAKGGVYRRYTLTAPNEYSPYRQPWPTHGFMTVDLSPNTMNVNLWSSGGGVQYEFAVTHDWMRQAEKLPEERRNMWPPPEVVLQAMKDELKLPRGPGGGTAFLANGTQIVMPENITNTTTEERTPSGTEGTEAPEAPETSPSPSAAPVPTPTPDPLIFSPVVPDFIHYAVSAECDNCSGTPHAGRAFTVRVSGVDLGPSHRVYLTSALEGCVARHPPLSPSRVVSPSSNTIRFTVANPEEHVYVCFSVNAGTKYDKITREDSSIESLAFSVRAP